MPVRELKCETPSCDNFGITYEWFAKSTSKSDPKCPKCSVQMTRLISTFATPFTGTLDKYKLPNMERFQETHDGGHYAWRVKSSRLADGGPERVKITNIQEQREFCKAEGLIMPNEINSRSEISDDGKKLCTSGMKDQWETGLPSPEITKTGNPWLYIEE